MSSMTDGEKRALEAMKSNGGRASIPTIVMTRLKGRGLAEADPDNKASIGRGYVAARLTAAGKKHKGGTEPA